MLGFKISQKVLSQKSKNKSVASSASATVVVVD